MPFPGSGADDAFDYLFKIILIGDSNVGKTCVVHRFKTGQYNEKQQNTIGVDFTVRSMDIDGKKVKVGVGSGPSSPLAVPSSSRCWHAQPLRLGPAEGSWQKLTAFLTLPFSPGVFPSAAFSEEDALGEAVTLIWVPACSRDFSASTRGKGLCFSRRENSYIVWRGVVFRDVGA